MWPFFMSVCEGMCVWKSHVWSCDVSFFLKVSQGFALMFLIASDEDSIFIVRLLAVLCDNKMD